MRYFRVNTIGEGYHVGKEIELEIDSFYDHLALAFQKLIFVSAEYNSEEVTWFQFLLHEDEDAGVGLFYHK